MSDLEQRLSRLAEGSSTMFRGQSSTAVLLDEAADRLRQYREALEGAREAIENQDECEAIAIIRTALKETTDVD